MAMGRINIDNNTQKSFFTVIRSLESKLRNDTLMNLKTQLTKA